MKFDVKVVFECLKSNGEVFTVREWETKNKFSVVPVNNIGDCIKEKLFQVGSMVDLVPYVGLSGFGSAQEWWDKIISFGAENGWLYKVTILETEFPSPPISANPKMVITFTGNRDLTLDLVSSALQNIWDKYPDAVWRTGMAFGLDLAVAEFAADNGITFEAHLPFEADLQCSKWNATAQNKYHKLLVKASAIFTHSTGFSMGAYQFRNVQMANGADIVVAFNHHARGGTVNMINHCNKVGIAVVDGFSLLNDKKEKDYSSLIKGKDGLWIYQSHPNDSQSTVNASDKDKSASESEVIQAFTICRSRLTGGCKGECKPCWFEAVKIQNEQVI